ncbi:MAG: hypothetical protein ACI3Y2_03550 [Candidatus Egerieousia sp.]
MNKYFIFLTFTILLGIGSCVKKDNHGLPNKVIFTKDGGETTITGDHGITRWQVFKGDNYVADEEFTIDENKEIVQKCGWLTLKYKENGYTTTLIAEPLTDGNKRILSLHYSTWNYTDVGVVQVPKDSIQLGLKPKKK